MLRARVTGWLERSPKAALTTYGIATAFATYFTMYAFRKPFAAASYEGLFFAGTHVSLKTALVISQIIGYALSKYIGIKVCSEVTRRRRAPLLVSLVLLSELALVAFALLPSDLRVIAIFFNGLPLGMIWGLVVVYLEGRRTSDLLLSGLSCSFIVASGVVKDAGLYLMRSHGVSEAAMPFVTGLFFLGPFLLSVWLLDCLPPPSRADVAARSLRMPMLSHERRAFVRRYLPGLAGLFAVYLLLTAFRDYRDNYGIDLFIELGEDRAPALFSRTEVPAAFVVLATMALLNLIRDARKGVMGAFAIMILGLASLGAATLLRQAGAIDGIMWMTLLGAGSYLAYVPYNSVLFERIFAHTRAAGTAVFAIYVADALGYTGSVALQLGKDLGAAQSTRLAFFDAYTLVLAATGVVLLLASGIYFTRAGQAPPQGEMR